MTNLSNEINGAATYKLGAWSCVVLLLYTLATLAVVGLIGGPPASVQECFDMLRENRTQGFLRLDVLTVFVMPFYYLLFFVVGRSLRPINKAVADVAVILIFAGVTIFLAAPSVFSYVRLSDAYWQAGSDQQRENFKAAAEAILASDIWNGTGARISGLMVQTGTVILSFLMLRSGGFKRITAITGILTHGLDLLHILVAFFLPAIANGIMGVAGVLYLIWFPLIIIDLFRLSKASR